MPLGHILGQPSLSPNSSSSSGLQFQPLPRAIHTPPLLKLPPQSESLLPKSLHKTPEVVAATSRTRSSGVRFSVLEVLQCLGDARTSMLVSPPQRASPVPQATSPSFSKTLSSHHLHLFLSSLSRREGSRFLKILRKSHLHTFCAQSGTDYFNLLLTKACSVSCYIGLFIFLSILSFLILTHCNLHIYV